jgi:hypothetical protein
LRALLQSPRRESGFDFSSRDALRASSRQMGRERHPDFNAIKGDLADKRPDKGR